MYVANLFNPRVLKKSLERARWQGLALPEEATTSVQKWITQLTSGSIARLSESQVEQAFNSQIFGHVLGYQQIGEAPEASLMPKLVGETGRDIPDFVLGRFDPAASVEDWRAVGEIKGSNVDLDQPQLGRSNKETPVEQAFRYAMRGRPGIEWIIVSNFRQVRLYKNGYAGAYHQWEVSQLSNENALYEFYALLRPASLTETAGFASRVLQETLSTGVAITEGFYGLYKDVQQRLLEVLSRQDASKSLTVADLYGKTHKLLNRILFACFCEDHPAELLPRETVKAVRRWAQSNGKDGYWKAYRDFFTLLNEGGGKDGVAFNAFNGGLFSHDPYLAKIQVSDELFTERFQAGKGKTKSREIVGVFGFDVYDFSEDLNAQALGAIFEQSLKDIPKGARLVRGFGELEVSTQRSGGVYYTPREITSYMMRHALDVALRDLEDQVKVSSKEISVAGIKDVIAGEATYRMKHPGIEFQRICVTNQFFNENAHQHAALNKVDLVDQDRLAILLKQHPVTMLDVEKVMFKNWS